jgi:hypothetical protein
MAHFAQINERLEVVQVLVVPNSQEHRGQEFLANDLGLGGRWIQTSYNSNFRKNYAAIGMYYDENRDAFIPPRPHTSYMLDEETCLWIAPFPMPDDGKPYRWNEELVEWEEVTE